MLSQEVPIIFGDGKQLRDYTYVGDVVMANMAASKRMEKLNRKEVSSPDDVAYNIGTGRPSSVNKIYEILAEITMFPHLPQYAPERKGEIHKTYLAIENAKKHLGWEARMSLEEGLKRTMEWFKETS